MVPNKFLFDFYFRFSIYLSSLITPKNFLITQNEHNLIPNQNHQANPSRASHVSYTYISFKLLYTYFEKTKHAKHIEDLDNLTYIM